MLFDDDLDPKTKKARLRPLDNMSVPELKDYLTQLKAEIARVETDLQKKEKYKSAAESLFKT
jgi:uncharacterized small protein (DUF1192 family)